MICPNGNGLCDCLVGRACEKKPSIYPMPPALSISTPEDTAPPKTSMEDIERLVDALVATCRSDGYVGAEADHHYNARAALLAAIREYGRE